MITVANILDKLCDFAPVETAMDFDNVGLLCGRRGNEVNRVLVSLDITKDVVKEAIEGQYDLIVAHHPIIWKNGLNAVTDDSQEGALILTLAGHGISAICMHTNLDAAEGGVGDSLAGALKLQNIQILEGTDNICRCGVLSTPMSEEKFVAFVKDALHCDGVRYMPSGKEICKVCVGGGSCGDYAEIAVSAGCDAFVTADIKYSRMLYAKDAGLTLIDAGHFNTEDVVCPNILKLLSSFPNLVVTKSKVHTDFIKFYK